MLRSLRRAVQAAADQAWRHPGRRGQGAGQPQAARGGGPESEHNLPVRCHFEFKVNNVINWPGSSPWRCPITTWSPSSPCCWPGWRRPRRLGETLREQTDSCQPARRKGIVFNLREIFSPLLSIIFKQFVSCKAICEAPSFYGWPTIKKKDLNSGAGEEISGGLLRCAAPAQRGEDCRHRGEARPQEERGEGLVL